MCAIYFMYQLKKGTLVCSVMYVCLLRYVASRNILLRLLFQAGILEMRPTQYVYKSLLCGRMRYILWRFKEIMNHEVEIMNHEAVLVCVSWIA